MVPDRGNVLIVGAGIVGLSTAYAAVRRGLSVTVIEQGPIPNPVAASCDHHRLIRYPYGDDAGYTARIGQAFAAWRAMWADLPGEPARYFADTGVLAASREVGDYTDRSRRVMEDLGIPFERVEGIAALDQRFPFLDPAQVSYALLSEGGALMANRIMVDLADWLRCNGATVLEHMPVVSVDPVAATVELGDGRSLGGDRVVIAAGIASAGLMGGAALALVPQRTVIVYAEPPADLQAAWRGAPCWTDLGGDTDLWGIAPVAGLPLKLGNGALGYQDPPAQNRTMQPNEIDAVLTAYETRFRGADRFRVLWHQANYWTLAPAERFLLHAQDRALLVSACSGHGFKFGALTGRDVVGAIMGDAPVAEIAARMAAVVSP